MSPHDDFVPVRVHVSLHERNWLGQDVEASTDEVDVKYLVVADNAKHSVVIVSTDLWVKADDNSAEGMRLHNALSLGKAEDVALVSDELEAGGQLRGVVHVQKAVSRALVLHFAKVD